MPLPEGIGPSTDLVQLVEEYQKSLAHAIKELECERAMRRAAESMQAMWKTAAVNLGRQVFELKAKHERPAFEGELTG